MVFTVIMLSLVIFTMSLFFVATMVYNKKLVSRSGALPIYERSELLVTIASTCNLIETIFNILAYILILKDLIKDETTKFIFFTLSFYFTRLYPACMALRVYRMIVLSKYRKGNLTRSLLKDRTSKTFIFVTINLYAVINLVVYELNYFVFKPFQFTTYDLNRTVYGFETFWFSLLFLWMALGTVHPSLTVEYFFYAVIWSSGAAGDQRLIVDRFLLIVPIRNSLLLLISTLSLKSHCLLIRPPLPFEPNLTEIFSIKELFEDFYNYTKTFKSEMHPNLDLFIQSHEAKFFNTYTFFLQSCSESGLLAREEINKSIESSFKLITDKLESDLEPYRLSYLNSPTYKTFQKSYFVYYN